MKIKLIIGTFIIMLQFMLLQNNLVADEVYLKNKDRLSGKVIEENEEVIIIETEALGNISIKREFIEKVSVDEKKEIVKAEIVKTEEGKTKLWEKRIALGYNEARGNSENSQLSLGFNASRKTEDNEFTVKVNAFYSSSNQEMDTQKWDGMVRYASSFWERKWYNFYKVEVDHDKFADINYRAIPSIGIGYWFSDEPDFKAMAEVALGWERTDFGSGKDNDEIISICRGYLQKKLFGESKISQDIFLYPSLSNLGDYRLHSETVLENPINDKLSLQLSLINDYNSTPPGNVKKNDIRLISSLVYLF